jgi:hypothetical protein
VLIAPVSEILLIAAAAAAVLYSANKPIVKRPKVDMILAVAAWMVVLFICTFLAAVTKDLFWLLVIGVYVFLALYPYADFMRGLSAAMLLIGIYQLPKYVVPAFLMIVISGLEITNKWDELIKFIRSKNRRWP